MSGIRFSTINFKGLATTDDGNEYNKTNMGKAGVTGLAALGSAGYSYYATNKIKKGLKTGNKFGRDFFKTLEENPVFQNLRKQLEEKKITTKEFRAQRSELIKKGIKWGHTGLIGITTLAGLAVGALVDHFVNKSRAEKADSSKVEA